MSYQAASLMLLADPSPLPSLTGSFPSYSVAKGLIPQRKGSRALGSVGTKTAVDGRESSWEESWGRKWRRGLDPGLFWLSSLGFGCMAVSIPILKFLSLSWGSHS